ncbi:F0F1 ATP synthase subunit A [Candidatus Babeliales bacterium]|nr:F0F1 ATP synthase subunit A [Candidatus Babeliales bacterium]
MEIKLFQYTVIKPLAFLGITHSFFNIHLDTLFYTWVGMLMLFIVVFIGRAYLISKPFSVYGLTFEQVMEFFIDLCKESLGFFKFEYFSFIVSIFFFTLTCNLAGLLPYVEESTKDLNTTLALGVSSFCFVQYQHIKESGISKYIKSFFEPLPFMLPLEIIGKLSSIISMSFRLFGNILGGSIVFYLLVEVVGEYKGVFMLTALIVLSLYLLVQRKLDLKDYPILKVFFFTMFSIIFALSWAQLFFGVFEGLIQAFVIAMLTLTYLSTALSETESTEEEVL